MPAPRTKDARAQLLPESVRRDARKLSCPLEQGATIAHFDFKLSDASVSNKSADRRRVCACDVDTTVADGRFFA